MRKYLLKEPLCLSVTKSEGQSRHLPSNRHLLYDSVDCRELFKFDICEKKVFIHLRYSNHRITHCLKINANGRWLSFYDFRTLVRIIPIYLYHFTRIPVCGTSFGSEAIFGLLFVMLEASLFQSFSKDSTRMSRWSQIGNGIHFNAQRNRSRLKAACLSLFNWRARRLSLCFSKL